MVNFFQDETSKGVRPKGYQGIIRCRPKNSEAMAMRSGAHEGLMCPLEKGVGGIKKERAERQGSAQRPNTKKERLTQKVSFLRL